MDTPGAVCSLPDSNTPGLCLTNPTKDELEVVYRMTFAEWGDSLTLPQYLEESDYLTEVPLARDGVMVSWILTDRTQPPNERPILGYCETFRKRAFVTDPKGVLSESVVYGIASVFVNPTHRRHGYGTRLMHELAEAIPKWHVGSLLSTASILYSDIGKDFYSKRGWPAFPVNNHIELDPTLDPLPTYARQIHAKDLLQLCQDDEAMVRENMATTPAGKTRMMIVPDVDHMMWHISKEDFVCQKIFGKVPQAKGAIAEHRGSRVWAVWVRRYYSHPDSNPQDNTLYILRFVVENQDPAAVQFKIQMQSVKAILHATQAEAAKWKLQCVKLWHPTPLVRELVDQSGLKYQFVEREDDSIASLRWFPEGGGERDDVEWVASEKYAWV